MKHINTVLGEIPPESLGFCQSHEHLCITKGQSVQINPDLCIDDTTYSTKELQAYRKAGGSAVVDAQPIGCGRDADMLVQMSLQSRVHIIPSTGFHKMLFYPQGHWIFSWKESQLAELFTKELTQGMYCNCDFAPPIQQGSHCAGQVKAALEAGDFSAQYQKLFCAAVQAATTAHAPLMVHIEAESNPIALADFLQARGMDLQRVIFCHMDRSIADMGIHKELCTRGITMEYDTICRPKYHSNEKEAALVMELLQAGFADHLLMSLDVTRARLRSYGGSVGLCAILESFLPLLHTCGVSSKCLQKIFVSNPAHMFAMEG